MVRARRQSGQSADNEQDAAAASGASQSGAKNTNISVRVLSDGDDGSVDQSNSVDSSATAANLNLTGQSAGKGSRASGGTQAIGQDADNNQSRVLCRPLTSAVRATPTSRCGFSAPASGGDVSQSNSVSSSANAGNLERAQAGREPGQPWEATASARPAAESRPSARMPEHSVGCSSVGGNAVRCVEHEHAGRVGSEGDDGDVSQSNSVDSDATALNVNLTGAGRRSGPRPAATAVAARAGSRRSVRTRRTTRRQLLLRSPLSRPAATCAAARRAATSTRRVRVSTATATVVPSTSQQRRFVCYGGEPEPDRARAPDQDQGGGGGVAGNRPGTPRTTRRRVRCRRRCSSAPRTATRRCGSTARATAATSRSRTASSSSATAANLNLARAACRPASGAAAAAVAARRHPGDRARTPRTSSAGASAGVLRPAAQAGGASERHEHACRALTATGDGGYVDQSNSVGSWATAANAEPDRPGCRSGSGRCRWHPGDRPGSRRTNQDGGCAVGGAAVLAPRTRNTPVRVRRRGDGGDVSQSEQRRLVVRRPLNAERCIRAGRAIQAQRVAGHCALRVRRHPGHRPGWRQNEQGPAAGSLAVQEFGRDKRGCGSGGNSNAPVRVDSEGDGGSVDQSNSVESSGTRCEPERVSGRARASIRPARAATQAIGQDASNYQAAIGLSRAALQHGASNSNSPVRVDSKGDGGDDVVAVEQRRVRARPG